jgi:ABC-type sugar transport system ATPase subunit
MKASALFLNNIVKYFGDVRALNGLSLELQQGELLALLGPSGCGKTTALHVVAGLIEPDDGGLSLFGRTLAGVAPRDRDVAMVFQGGALYPHLTVAQNLAFPIKARGKSGRLAARRMAERLGIDDLLDRYPSKISGGQAQRVALGRALIRKPKLFLLDEPLAGLDLPLREQLRELIRQLVKDYGVTTICVTHDQSDALAIGDRVAVMREGRITQIGTPREVYEKPKTEFVGRFIGARPLNFLPGIASGGSVVGSWGRLPIQGPGNDREVLCAFRPEHCRVIGTGQGIRGVVRQIDYRGHEVVVIVDLPGEVVVRFLMRVADSAPAVGEAVDLSVEKGNLLLFDASTGESI